MKPLTTTTAPTSVISRSRVPAGVTTGGEFATERTNEPTLTARPNRLGNFSNVLTEEEIDRLAESARISTRFWLSRKDSRGGRGYGYSSDVSDISQATALKVLESINRMGEAPTNMSSYVMTTARHVVSDANPNGRNWENTVANAQLHAWKEEFRSLHEREAMPTEVAAYKNEIIEGWPDQMHRPSQDFDSQNSRLAPLEIDADIAETLATKRFPGDGLSDDIVDADSAMGQALAAVRDKKFSESGADVDNAAEEPNIRARMAEMRRMSWNAFAETVEDLPPMIPKLVSPRRAAKLRVSVKEAGGVAAVCNQWSVDGDSEITDGLFAPFGNITFEQQESVVAFLTSHRLRSFTNGAEILWDHALTGATNRKRAGDE